MKKRPAFVAAVFLWMFTHSVAAHATCHTDASHWDKSVSAVIPVYISTWSEHSIQQVLPNRTVTEIGLLVQWALDVWYEDNPSGIRLVYGGTWSSYENFDPAVPKLLIRADDATSSMCGGAPACTIGHNCGGTPACTNYQITLKRETQMPGSNHWGVVPPGVGGTGFHDFVGILVHEIGHVLGMRHPAVCGQTDYYGTMNCQSNGFDCNPHGDARTLQRDDKQGALETYGWRTTYSRHMTSTNGASSWTTGSPVMHNYYPDLPFGSVSTNNSPQATKYLAFPYNFNARFAKYTASGGWSWPHQSLEWTTHGNTWKPVSIAVNGNDASKVLAVWLAEETPTNDLQNIRFAISTNSAASWQYGYMPAWWFWGIPILHTTRKKDVRATWDPNTGRWIVSWITSENVMVFQTIDTNGATSDPVYYSSISVANAPAVACSSAQSVQPYNCLVMYIQNDEVPVLRYSYGKIESSQQFVLNGVDQSTLYVTYRSPGITVQPGNESYPFIVSFRAAGTVFTFRKPASTYSALQPMGQMSVAPQMMTATSLGYYASSGQSYLWAAYLNTYD